MSDHKKSPISPARKRQLGAEKSTAPLPMVHNRPSDRAVAVSRLAIIATVVFWAAYVVTTIFRQFLDNGTQSFRFTMEAVSYSVVVTFLTFSALMYLLARHGAMVRFRDHVRVPRAELDRHFTGHDASITVLVPSYAEEPSVVRGTLWSAALQEYPAMRVVLLLDDPPTPTDPQVALKLAETRALAQQIRDDLSEPRLRFADTLIDFQLRSLSTPDSSIDEVYELARQYGWASGWLSHMADDEHVDDHVDVFFVDQVLRALAAELDLVRVALTTAAEQGHTLTLERMLQLYRRLAWTFDAELATFERKQYESLSHEANKAMNLNSYIGLMGHAYDEERTPTGTILREVVRAQSADLVFPDSTYLLTLDADSILLREYCLRLVYFLEQPGNERVAVTQTPYSSFRGAGTRIERLAGASTDLQHILHQGMSYYGAAFWVGANAVIRKSALLDIEETDIIGGFVIKRYVQDRTVIEDTESSVDLGTHGWTIANYPERLSYSATPPDFGSLIVQRRRWANGGLLIIPKFFRQVKERRARGERVRLSEILLRVNYMASIAWSSFGLMFLLAYPYDSRLLSPVVLLAALPYFLSMGADLRSTGYRFSDILRIYGFNLILLPVNLAGVLKSIEQSITVKKIPFSRTPKVKNRTAAPLLYVVAPIAIIVLSVVTLWGAAHEHNWGNAAFAGLNAVLSTWALVSYIGIKNSIIDIWLGATGWLFVPVSRRKSITTETFVSTIDWESVLYTGALDESHAKTVRPRVDLQRSFSNASRTGVSSTRVSSSSREKQNS